MRIFDGEHGRRSRFCLTCFSRLTIDLAAETILDAVQETPLDGKIVGRSGLKSIILCPVCGNRWVAFFKKDSTVYGDCEVCDRLLRATDSLAEDASQ